MSKTCSVYVAVVESCVNTNIYRLHKYCNLFLSSFVLRSFACKCTLHITTLKLIIKKLK